MKKTLKHLLPALFLAAVMALLTGCTKSVDLLQYADVTFDGASGNATATVTLDYNGLGKELFGKGKDQDIWDEAQTELSLMGHVNYTVTPQTGLSNGDTVTLTVHSNRDDFSDCIDKYGAMPQATEKTFTVEGLNEYVTSADNLSDTTLASLQSQAEDVLKAHIAQEWNSETETLTGMDYLGNYILTRKSDSTWAGNKNGVILAYKVNVHNHYQNYDDQVYDANNSYYWYICFRNVCVDGEGNVISGLNDYGSPNAKLTVDSGLRIKDSSDKTKYWYYYGYGTLDELYSSAVTTNVENYNHQDNVNA